MKIEARDIPLATEDGHRFTLMARIPEQSHATLLWLPALGVAARHYLPLAEALAARGITVYLHEWRGNGSSSLRANRENDWGYQQVLTQDLPASHAAMRAQAPATPHYIGGHSLGGQLAACYLGLQPEAFRHLWLVGSGTPYWHTFPGPRRYMLPLFYRFSNWISQRRGALPGRRMGFGGDEARSLIRDWSRVGLTGRYAATGLEADLELAMGEVKVDATGVVLLDDWLAPTSSLQALLDKLPDSRKTIMSLYSSELGVPADHFAWMKRPRAVVNALLDHHPDLGDRP